MLLVTRTPAPVVALPVRVSVSPALSAVFLIFSPSALPGLIPVREMFFPAVSCIAPGALPLNQIPDALPPASSELRVIFPPAVRLLPVLMRRAINAARPRDK
ncbi:hypothetical protein GYC90_000367 [Salmonella enterica]|nr:hypothetical protein [Salmonella enterica]